MASEESILLDYQRAIQQAEALETIAASLEKIAAQGLGDSLEDLAVAWKGQNADAYIRKGDKLKDNLEASAENLRKIAGNIRTTADNIKKAEIAALGIVFTRGS